MKSRNRRTTTPLARAAYVANKHRSLSELIALVSPQHDVLEMTLAEILCYAPVELARDELSSSSKSACEK